MTKVSKYYLRSACLKIQQTSFPFNDSPRPDFCAVWKYGFLRKHLTLLYSPLNSGSDVRLSSLDARHGSASVRTLS